MIFRTLLKRCSRNVFQQTHFRYETVRNISSFHYEKEKKSNYFNSKRNFLIAATILGTSLIINNSSVFALQKDDENDDAEDEKDEEIIPGLEIETLPTYSLEEVSKHSTAEESIWVVYKAGVYDVTEFTRLHPGGDYVLLAAGNSIEPFWEIYGQHKTQQVYKLLESFRIGNLRKEDRLTRSETESESASLEYIPERNPKLIKHHDKPFNAETPLKDLIKSFLTSNEDFFIRNHSFVPEVDAESYELEIGGLTLENEKTLTLNDLKTLFPKHSVISVIQCGGNRREPFNEVKEVRGISWMGGAIGNAKWSGARLVDILKYCGADLEDKRIKHVIFEGLDLDATSSPYGASVPADKALDSLNKFIIAYEMNDQPIPPDHGYPVRLIAPGIVGARNVKWLGRIILSEIECTSHWQRRDYKSFPSNIESVTGEEFEKAYAIQELPIQSAICSPLPNEEVPIQWKFENDSDSAKPYLEIKGYAWSGGGRPVIRVDISVDNGKTWLPCEMTDTEEDAPSSHTYSWVLWKGEIPLGINELYKGRKVNVLCRAWDSAYNTQPKEASEIWNFRGLLNNSWHRVSFTQK